MPNHCTNSLQLLRSKKSILSVLKKYISSDYSRALFDQLEPMYLDLNKIKPVPDGLYRYIFNGRPRSILSKWKTQHWGTSRNTYDTVISEEENTIYFSTMWNPPFRAIQDLAKLIKLDLRLTYVDGENKWVGVFTTTKSGKPKNRVYPIKYVVAKLKK